MSLEVKDALGRTVHREAVLHELLAVDLSSVPSGMYNLLLIAHDGRQAAAKWVKQ